MKSPHYKFNVALKQKEAVAQLTGIAGGLIYDGKLDDKEILFLHAWLEEHVDFVDTFPISTLYKLLTRVLEDGKLEKNEISEVFEFLVSIGSLKILNPVVGDIYDAETKIIFASKTFLFTGELGWGSRADAIEAVTARGGKTPKSSTVTKSIDYLVVGDLGSDSWKHSRFGRIIQQAVDLKESGYNICIVQEEDFIKALMT